MPTDKEYQIAHKILYDILEMPGHPTADDVEPRRATDYVGTANGLCQVDVSTSIYGGWWYIGPVIGQGGKELMPCKYFHQKYNFYAALYLAECLNA